MRLKNFMVATAVASLVASPVLAANPAAKLSIAPAARASAKAGKSELAGGGFVIAAIAAAAVIAGIIIIADNDSDSN